MWVSSIVALREETAARKTKVRTWCIKVIRDRRAQRLEHQPVRSIGAGCGFHGQLKEIILGASVPADQGRRDGR